MSDKYQNAVLQPSQKIEFLGVILGSKEMTISLRQERVLAIREQCYLFLAKYQVSAREISQLIGKFFYLAIAILPAPFQYKFLERSGGLLSLDIVKPGGSMVKPGGGRTY